MRELRIRGKVLQQNREESFFFAAKTIKQKP
jgi:hypothetical protein